MTKFLFFLNAVFISILSFFSPKETAKTNMEADMPMCRAATTTGLSTWRTDFKTSTFKSISATSIEFQTDSTKTYSMPLLATTTKGDVMLSWTERDVQGVTAFCFSVSKDKGKTFSEKKMIYAGNGVSNSRLMRAKVLTKKDGSLVAVFSNRADAPAGNQQGGGRSRGGRSSDIVYSESKDGGDTWTKPQSVDSDPTKGIVRGFFDAVVMSNDEVAVAYLKDVANSTKNEERNLRLVITKNGVFQPERVIDPIVCDCCNINMLIDAQGALNVYYRDNNDDIRDFARMTSTDNGTNFSKPQIIYNDGWKIEGCPHNGAISSIFGKSALVAWYSGAEKESGVKLATQEGKKLFVLSDESVKNPTLVSASDMAVMMWEQNASGNGKQIVFRKITGDKVSENISVEGSSNATNSTALILNNQLLIANEVKEENKKNGLKISMVNL